MKHLAHELPPARATVALVIGKLRAILLMVLSQSAAAVLDEVISLFDQAVSVRKSRARMKMRDEPAARATAGQGRQVLLDEILPVLVDSGIEEEMVGGLPRGNGHLTVLGGRRPAQVERRQKGCPAGLA
ncbi:hypothetical protein [Streptomyces sp. NPDC004685]